MLSETIEAAVVDDILNRQFQEYVKGNRLFILGAGFSAGAGIPTTASLLRLTMNKFAAECSGIFARVENYTRELMRDCADNIDYAAVDLSELCTFLEYIELREYGGGERWSENGSREKLALRFYLAKTLAEHCPHIDNIPNLYLQFASQLRPGDIVISFNWDTLLGGF